MAHSTNLSLQRSASRSSAHQMVPAFATQRSVSTHAVAVRPATRTVTAQPKVRVDGEALHQKLEARVKALVALGEQERLTRPLTRITIQKEVGLGEEWRICGEAPELGRFVMEIAPRMTWSQGHVWKYEGRLPAGLVRFKLLLRRANGAFAWEEGPDRNLQIPQGLAPTDVIEVKIDNVRLPAA